MSTQRERPYKTSLSNKVDLLFQSNPSEPQIPHSLSLSLIELSNFQPRSYFDQAKLDELAKTITMHGILEPLLVREKGDVFELIAGGRRYRAAQKAGLTEVPVIVLHLTDEQCLEVAMLENLQREDLNPIEETEGILKLLETRLQMERQDVTSVLYRLRNEQLNTSSRNVSTNPEIEIIEKTFEPLAINWKSFVETRLPLLKLPEGILNVLKEGKLEYTKAKAIAKLKDEAQRTKLIEEAIAQELSLSQIKERISLLESQESNLLTPTAQTTLSETYQKLKKAQLWKKDPKKWCKAQTLLKKLEDLLSEELEEIADG